LKKKLTRQAVLAQRKAIGATHDASLAEVKGRKHRITGRLITVPAIGLEIESFEMVQAVFRMLCGLVRKILTLVP